MPKIKTALVAAFAALLIGCGNDYPDYTLTRLDPDGNTWSIRSYGGYDHPATEYVHLTCPRIGREVATVQSHYHSRAIVTCGGPR